MADMESTKTPKNCCATTTKLPTNYETVVSGLELLAALYLRPFNPVWPPIWEEALSDLDAATIRHGFLELARTFTPTAACPFPTPAHIRRPLLELQQKALEQEAEQAWQDVVNLIADHWYVDLGGWRDENGKPYQPDLLQNKRIDRALDAAGGPQAISNSSDQSLTWRKKEFLAAYFRDEKLEQAHPALTDTEALKLLPVAHHRV